MEIDALDYMSLPIDELQEEYAKLYERHKELRQISETDAQQIHELKRSLNTANAVEAYLSQELEAISQNTTQLANCNKAQSELEELKRSYNSLKAEHISLQQDHESLLEENMQLQEQLKALDVQQKQGMSVKTSADLLPEQVDRLMTLEQENFELLHKLEELHEQGICATIITAEREKNIEILRDQVNCIKENLNSKREELEEKTQLLESAQEQLTEANAKIAMLMATPDNNARKGNSLFAEVDDQRQAMKQLLAAQKKSYLQMKKVYNESEYEIRRLKRENVAMHTELQACSSIFCNADKTYQEKLNERMRQLLNQNEELERKLKWTQERLNELANGKGVLWLDSMFNFCKQETNELKQQLHSLRIRNASLEEQLRNALQDMARWRFESLKSRCILMNRENLLNENKIIFKPNTAFEFDIQEEQLKAARPRILHTTATPIKVVEPTFTKPGEVKTEQISNDIVNTIATELQTLKAKTEIESNTEKNQKDINILNKIVDNANCKADSPLKVYKEEATKQSSKTEAPQSLTNKHTSPLKELTGNVEVSALNNEKHNSTNIRSKKLTPPPADTLPGPSILCKQRDIFAKELKPNVKFSTEEAIVHDLSVDDACEGISKQQNMITTQKLRTKSSIIVRRVVVGTKLERI